MRKKIKKSLSVITLICCMSTNFFASSNIVSALHCKRRIVFIGQITAQKSKFINQLCSKRNTSEDSVIKTTYNNEEINFSIFDTLPLDSTNFNENFQKYYKDHNLVVLAYNADNVVSGEDNLESVLEFGYNRIKDLYTGQIVVLGISWDPKNLLEGNFRNSNDVDCIAKRIFQQQKFAFSMVIGGGENFGFNVDYFINSLCEATINLEENNCSGECSTTILLPMSPSSSSLLF